MFGDSDFDWFSPYRRLVGTCGHFGWRRPGLFHQRSPGELGRNMRTPILIPARRRHPMISIFRGAAMLPRAAPLPDPLWS